MPARILIVDDEAKSEVNVISPTCASTIGIAIEQANSQTAGLLRRKTLEYLLPYVVRNSYAVIRNLQHVATPSLRQLNLDPSLYIERILLDCFEIDGNLSSIQRGVGAICTKERRDAFDRISVRVLWPLAESWCRDARHLPTILPRSSTWQQNEGRRNAAPQCVFDYAAFFEVLAAGSAVFFALSFAANSCLTLAAMASGAVLQGRVRFG